MNHAKRKSIAIIGAGVSGLRCADVLLQHGYGVTIFEARNRIGGRIAQTDLNGHEVDLGANWIHGTDDNPIYDLALKTETTLHDWNGKQLLWDIDGRLIPGDEAAEYSRLLWDDGLISEAFAYSKKHTDTLASNRSLHDYFKDRVKDTFTDLDPHVAEARRKTLMNNVQVWGAYVGSSVKRQSLKFFWLEECIDGENPFVAGTYRKIMEEVSRKALALADIRLNTRVREVRHDDSSNGSTVTVADGEEHTFDEVIVTIPLGYLKRNKDALLPGLSPRIDQAISNIGYGCLDKIYLTFPEAFWRRQPVPASNGTSTTDAPHSSPNVRAVAEPINQRSQDGDEDDATSFYHWLGPDFDSEGDLAQWDVEALDLSLFPGSLSSPTLLFYIYGDCSKYVAKLVASLSTDQARTAALTKFMTPYLSKMPHYSKSDPACTPSAALATAWAGDELAGYGSYCNFQVGMEQADKDVEAIREGMPERGLWFAGEHTSPFVALGTATGAYWSGQKVAERIVAKHAE